MDNIQQSILNSAKHRRQLRARAIRSASADFSDVNNGQRPPPGAAHRLAHSRPLTATQFHAVTPPWQRDGFSSADIYRERMTIDKARAADKRMARAS